MKKISVGQIVRILDGREAGKHAVVIDIESSSFVWLADGKTRLVDKPKKKNIKHVQGTKRVADIVTHALQQRTLTNADLRSGLNQYLGLKDVNE